MGAALVIAASLISTVGASARGGGGGGGHVGGGHSSYSGTSSNSYSHSVSGYTNSHGTHVAPYHATNPNGTQRDNYSTKGNVNPYTGAIGTKEATH